MIDVEFRLVVTPANAAAEPCAAVGAPDGPSLGEDRPIGRGSAVAVARDSGIVVACRRHHVVRRYASDGAPVAAWGEAGTRPGQFRDPRAVAVLADGRVVVADALNGRLQVFSDEGDLLAAWTPSRREVDAAGFAGAAARAVFAPSALAALADGRLFVASGVPEGAVVLLSADGVPIDVLDGAGAPRRPVAVAAMPGGAVVYAASGMGGSIARCAGGQWSPVEIEADALRGWALLPALAVGGDGALWVAARSRLWGDRHALLRVDPDGGSADGFALPAGFAAGGITVDRFGRVVVAGAGGEVVVLELAAGAALLAA